MYVIGVSEVGWYSWVSYGGGGGVRRGKERNITFGELTPLSN